MVVPFKVECNVKDYLSVSEVMHAIKFEAASSFQKSTYTSSRKVLTKTNSSVSKETMQSKPLPTKETLLLMNTDEEQRKFISEESYVDVYKSIIVLTYV